MNRSSFSHEKILQGALLICATAFMIAVMNSTAKLLSGNYHPVELIFYRNLVVLAALLPFFHFSKQWHLVKTTRPKAHIARALIGTTGVGLAFWAVSLLPLADATTIMYTAPLFVTMLSYPLLKEKVGPWRWGAVLIGFIGVVLIAKPTGEDLFIFGILIALSAALFHGTTQILLRDMGKTEHPLTTVFYFMAFGTIATGLILPFIWSGNLKKEDFFLILLLGVTGGLQQIFKTKGYSLAPVSIISPFNYTGLIWATILGWMLWDDLPSWGVILGGAIIIISNIFIIWRENRKKKNV